MRHFAILILLVAGLVPAAAALELQVLAQRAPGDWLVAQLRAEGLLDDELLSAIRSGLPTRFRFEVELWRDRSHLWDQLEAQAVAELRVVYDPLDQEYRVFDGSGNAVLDTADPRALESLIGSDALELGAIEDLRARREYYLVARLHIRPLSVEEIRDLERWLRGSVREGGGIGPQILGIVRQQLGLGDRSVLRRGRNFQAGDLPARGGSE